MIKKCGTCGIKYQHCNSFFENTNFKYDLIEYICLCCNKKYQQKVKQIFDTCKLFNHDNNKFILLL